MQQEVDELLGSNLDVPARGRDMGHRIHADDAGEDRASGRIRIDANVKLPLALPACHQAGDGAKSFVEV